MGKKNKTSPTTHALPLAPWIYINDPQVDMPYACALRDLIPIAALFDGPVSPLEVMASIRHRSKANNTIGIIRDNRLDGENDRKRKTAHELREATINRGCNFASINLYYQDGSTNGDTWGTNHLDLCITGLSVSDVAERVYKWLFTAFTVQETLHLIPEKELRTTDHEFPDYAYCTIAEQRHRPKDALVQFVVVITSKPEVQPGKVLRWTVADRTGTASFFFRWRGPSSQETWDWVLKLQPGDRKALPRMPMIEFKEGKSVLVAKAPFRCAAAVIGGAGFVIRSVGNGLSAVATKVKMGESSVWVPEADVADYKKMAGRSSSLRRQKVKAVEGTTKTEIKIFNEKGEKVWKDDDSVASTTAGSIWNEKTGKEFC